MTQPMAYPMRIEHIIRRALSVELAYPERPPAMQGVPAAVLMVIGQRMGQSCLLLTRRTQNVETHKGQMAFPGGHSEPEEIALTDEGSILTALRETEEEVGIPRASVQVLGRLPGLWTVTGYWVTPIVGLLMAPIDEMNLTISQSEIAETVWIPFSQLVNPAIYTKELRRVGEVEYPIHVFQVGDFRIWGATGSMIRNFLDRLEKTGGLSLVSENR